MNTRRFYCFSLLYAFLGIMIIPTAWAQESPQKYALVIGNGAYTGISRLNNPVNDAEDMTAALRDLGFTVDTVLNGNLEQMENAVIRLKDRLGVSRNTYGFFFYAGHGVQSNGENYLIPVDANIQSEGNLRVRAVSVQAILDDINDAGNELNMFVLDACRDNPFGWRRSGSRGLAIVTRQPADSIVVYATSAGSAADDGTGRNGLFTSHLLNNISTPGITVNEVFRRTMGDVTRASNNQQRPAIYSQFSEIAYLGNWDFAAELTLPPLAVISPSQPPRLPDTRPNPIRYGFMNLALGLGSYVQGDIAGGLITTSGLAIGLGWSLLINSDAIIPGERYDWTDQQKKLYDFSLLGAISVGVATAVFSFIRPYVFNNKQQAASFMRGVTIEPVSYGLDQTALRFGYTLNF